MSTGALRSSLVLILVGTKLFVAKRWRSADLPEPVKPTMPIRSVT